MKREIIKFLLFASLVMISPLCFKGGYLLNVLVFVGIHTMLAVGLNLLLGFAGQISLGQAAFFGLGAYISGILTTAHSVNPWLAMVLAALTVGILAFFIGFPILKLKGHYLAMATLGFGELASLAFAEATPLTGGVDGMTGIPFPTIAGFAVKTPAGLYWLVWLVAGAAILLAANMVGLRPGRSMRALHGSELGAAACGVDVVGVKVRAFVVSAALAGLAGALYASVVGFISPSLFTLQASVSFLAMAVIGGTGSLAGPIVATALLTLLEYVDALVPGLSQATAQAVQSVKPDIYGLAIVLVVIFAPGGIGAIWRRRPRGGEAQ